MGKQTRIEGKELQEVRLDRIALQQKEKDLAAALIAVMTERGCARFVVTDYDPPFYAKLRPGATKVQVRDAREDA